LKSPSTLESGLQAIVNQLLELDPDLVQGIAELEGSVLEVHVQGIDIRFQLQALPSSIGVVLVHGIGQSSGIARDAARDVTPDVTISGPPFTLARLLGSKESVDGVLPPDVFVTGDLQMMQKLMKIARGANIDWEEPLSRLFGDTLAHELGRGIRGFVSWFNTASDSFAWDVGEYLREERHLAPTRIEVDDFASRVDQTRDDVERADVRISRLASRVREL
jgi:ubiquinone biosynthesis accessory factor UbiJ